MLYEWDYDEDKDTYPSSFPFRSYDATDFTFATDPESSLLFYYGDVMQPAGQLKEDKTPHPTLAKQKPAGAAAAPRSGRLSAEKTWLLREHLKGLYALLKAHPALMHRRLRVGSQKPHIPHYHPDYFSVLSDSGLAASGLETHKRLSPSSQHHPHPHHPPPQLPTDATGLYATGPQPPSPPSSPPPTPSPEPEKRSFTHLSSSQVCPAHTEWRLLHVARDINNTEVEVFQPTDGSEGHQWFYTTTCHHDSDQTLPDLRRYPDSDDCPNCCRGVNRHRYHSYCMTKTSFVMALVRKPRQRQYDWNWIQVNSSCTCYISPA